MMNSSGAPSHRIFPWGKSSIVLVVHGSRDLRHQVAICHLAHQFQQQLQRLDSDVQVNGATLEFGLEPLHGQLDRIGRQILTKASHDSNLNDLRTRPKLHILPLFLLSGNHVVDDIPQEVELAKRSLQGEVDFIVHSHLGSYGQMVDLLQMQMDPEIAWILYAHGSRRSEAVKAIETLATQLGMLPAFWANPPHLEEQVKKRAAMGCQQIGVIPYFLFEGGIVDAIVAQVRDLNQYYPAIQFQVTEPLSLQSGFTELISQIICNRLFQ